MKKHSTFNIQHSTSNCPPANASFDVGGFTFHVSRITLLLRQIGATLGLVLALTVFADAQETRRQYLSGHDKDDAVPWEFQCTYGANSGFWTNLLVPSHWDMHGFGTLNYHKDATNAWDERGRYAHTFTVPRNWSGQRIFLVFDGVMTDTDAQINGQSVGPVHQGSFYRFKYEVTSLVKTATTNRLTVTVAKHSANDSVNKAERLADYWVFGGIFRPVYLEAVPPQFIERVAIDAQADGKFSMDVFADGAGDADTIEAQIKTLDGKNVGAAFSSRIAAVSLSSPKGGEGRGEEANLSKAQNPSPQPSPRLGGERESASRAKLVAQISAPRQWTAETPNLYSVEVRLKRGGKVLHRFTQRFGFRTFEVRDGDGLYLNGRRVILKGANRHSFWPDSGRCLSEKIHRLDIETMKDMNMNAVRMSHYPPDERFLDLCDELGLYVLDELAGWHNKYDNEIGPKLVKEMVVRDVNHPSILFWDNGNEGGFNTSLDHLFPELDPQHRRVLHPWATFSGINTAHYLAYDKAAIAAGGQSVYYSNNQEIVATNDPAKYIYMPTEFMHGLFDGGAAAGLDDYWKMMTASKTLGGGFIWALTDDAVKRPDTGEMDTAGNQAPDGIVGPYRQREGSFYAIKEIWSPIQVTRETNGTFTVENHFSFTDASECKSQWQLRKYSQPNQKGDLKILAKGKIASTKVAPMQSGSLEIQFPESEKNADAVALRVCDPLDRELWTFVWPSRNAPVNEAVRHSAKKLRDSRPSLFTKPAVAEAIGLQSRVRELWVKDFVARIDEATGQLKEVVHRQKKFSFNNGPRLATTNSILKQVAWQLRDDGWITCDYTYTANGTNDYFGVLFDYPENLVRHKRWLGDGPFRVWKNRLRGVTLNVWENDYNNTLTGWRDWIYPEFKGFFANVRWLQLDTTEGLITVVNNSQVPFMQVLTPEFAPTNLVAKTFVPVPSCGLGFLDAIPAIGSKFKDATFTGPQGQPSLGRGEYSGSVSFYFGKLP